MTTPAASASGRTAPATAPDLLAAAIRADPTRPLLTHYDDATGERVELSGTTFGNWVAKTANLLVDGAWSIGDGAAVLLPPHWQHAAVVFGCWSAGLTVLTGAGTGASTGESTGDTAARVSFATLDTDPIAAATHADDRYVLSLHPLGAPVASPPEGTIDFATEVRVQGDHFVAADPVTPGVIALISNRGDSSSGGPDRAVQTHSELIDSAVNRAKEWGLTATDRVLVAVDDTTSLRDWLLAPLVAGASVVLVRHADPKSLTAKSDTENATVTIIDGTPVTGEA